MTTYLCCHILSSFSRACTMIYNYKIATDVIVVINVSASMQFVKHCRAVICLQQACGTLQ